VTSFVDLGLSAPLLRAVRAENYTTPTPIQAKAIPHLVAGRDLLGCAQTGTGPPAAAIRSRGRTMGMQVFVRDNDVDYALRQLKRKLRREGLFRELKRRRAYEKPSERRARERVDSATT
jgi:ribosomal protein S21